jgi:hypothetical protein
VIDDACALDVFLGVARHEAARGRWYPVGLALGAIVRVGGELAVAALHGLTEPDQHPDLRVLAAASLEFLSNHQPPTKESPSWQPPSPT